jgi:hypothetical protein
MIDQLFLHSGAEKPPLRIGIMLDSAMLPAWLAGVLRNLRDADFCEISCLIWNATPSPPATPPRSLPVKMARLLGDAKRRGRLFYSLYDRMDRRFFPAPSGAGPFEQIDCSELLEGAPEIRVVPIASGFTHRFREDDLDAIRAQKLDVILRWGFNIIRGAILETATYGVWSYHHGDSDYYRGGPPAFWETAEGAPVIGVILQVLSDELDGGKILAKGIVSTASGLSVNRNRFEQYWLGSSFVIEKLWQLHRHGWPVLERTAWPNNFRGKQKIYRTPGNAKVARFLTPRLASRVSGRLARSGAVVGHWKIAIRKAPSELDPTAPSTAGFEWKESPRGQFWADPMLFARDGRRWVFFEDYDYGTALGTIACAELAEDGALGPVETVLAPGFHLSYPHLFEDSGEVFMIPESGANATVDLYVASDFPRGWKKVKTLLSGQAAYDTTLWVEDGIYWFFVTLEGRRGSRYQLLLFSADSLTGEWTLHPQNPIGSDIRSARGGGPLFRAGGRLVRPAQDCSRAYGGGLVFEEIVTLNPREYRSAPLGRIDPGAFPNQRHMIGAHTYSRAGGFEAIDGCWKQAASLHKPL